MTPLEIYNSIASYLGDGETTICDIKAKCKQFKSCINKSSSTVLDFDGAATTYAKSQTPPISTPQSVDAIALDCSKTLLVLIEKKTWEKFLDHLTGSDKFNPQSAALDKVKSFDLQGKYQSTRTICEYITCESGFFQNLSHVFVFLSEFSDKAVMGGFANTMFLLASTSSTVDYAIQQHVVDGMRKHLTTVSCSKSRYLNCMEFDDFLKNPY
mgnify:CR=1 FL=1